MNAIRDRQYDLQAQLSEGLYLNAFTEGDTD